MNPKTQVAVGKKILVLIDKEQQRSKTTLASGLVIAPSYEYMNYFLQYGPIVSVGDQVDNPHVKVGRTAIFHHRIEDESERIIYELENGNEIRICRTSSDNNSHELLGVIDEDGNIIPVPSHVICLPEKREDLSLTPIYDENSGSNLVYNTKQVGSLFVAEIPKDEDKEYFHTCKVVFTNPEENFIQPDDMVTLYGWAKYPLEINGTKYWWVLRDFIVTKHQ